VISFRYHVVSLVAVLLALAVGIALGGGPLQRTRGSSDGGDSGQSLVEAQTQIAQLERSTGFVDDYADSTAGTVLGGALDGRAVTLVALPGADDAAVTRAGEMVDRAGGSVTLRAAVGQKLLDVGSRQLVSELAGQMASSGGKELEEASKATGYEQMGLLIAEALVTHKKAGDETGQVGQSILAGLDTADLLTVTGDAADPGRRGSLLLLVAGDPYGTADQRDGAGSILSSLVTVLDGRSDGVVLAGPVASSADDGLVGAVRADPTAAGEVSTVDAVERTAGAVVAVLALEAEASGTSGHYGTDAAGDGALPGAPKRD
jgi:hypothetical protein